MDEEWSGHPLKIWAVNAILALTVAKQELGIWQRVDVDRELRAPTLRRSKTMFSEGRAPRKHKLQKCANLDCDNGESHNLLLLTWTELPLPPRSRLLWS